MIRGNFALAILFWGWIAMADVGVLTQHNDNSRTGANLDETILATNNVNPTQFGLLFTRPVDDVVYAQPLVMTNLSFGSNGVHNIVIIATANDTVYAYDADAPSVAAPYWQVSFLGPNIVAPNRKDFSSGDAGPCPLLTGSGNSGILGTPVIDPDSATLYLVAETKEISGTTTNFVQRLHALDLGTGAERPNSPVVISATLPATNNYDATNGFITFNPYTQNQHGGLALANGILYICWASHCDYFKYHGWVMAYDATNLQQLAVYCDTPSGSQGGIWMGGAAPAADPQGNIYLSTGNGTVGDSASPADLINRGESFLKLNLSGTNLNVASWFTPFNWATLNQQDADLGSGGLLLIPGTHLALSAGKQGVAYLVDRDNLGGLSLTNADTNVLQSLVMTNSQIYGGPASSQIYGGPVWWDGPDGSYAYFWPAPLLNGIYQLQQYKFDPTNQVLLLPAYAKGAFALVRQSAPALALSANGTNAGTGILWASVPDGYASLVVVGAYLVALDAQNVSKLLWDSLQNPTRDAVGNYAKFVPPTIANGKVYLATFSNRLDVYGLLPPLLSAGVVGSNVLVSWPTNNYSSYQLQTSLSLAPGVWVDVTNSVATTNGVFQVALPPLGATAFYRLKL